MPARPALKEDVEPVAYYDIGRSGFWKKIASGEYVPYSESSIRRVLKYVTYSGVSDKEANYAMCDRHLMKLQEDHAVTYAGPLGGFKSGLHIIAGNPVLVTKGPKLIVWKAGEWPLLNKLVTQLFGENVLIVYAWLKASLRTLYAGHHPFRPAPMLAIAGEPGGGKSLFQNIITELLGGRSAKPYRYLIGETNFNSDLFGVEHLMIEDDASQTDLRFRRTFGANLKNLVFNETQSMHRKGRDAFTVSVFSRVTITMNAEPENLAVLPPLDDSLIDKITLLRAGRAEFPYPKDDLVARKKYRDALTAELPAFVAFLRSWRVPERLQDQRSGVAAFQDKELMHELLTMAPESALLELLDKNWIWDGTKIWEGTANDLKEKLTEMDKSGRAAKLLEWRSACGTYLGKLVKQFPKRFAKKRHADFHHTWLISAPEKEASEETDKNEIPD